MNLPYGEVWRLPLDMSIELADIVEKYLAAAGAYGQQPPLAALGLSKEEIEDVFSAFDEDYHISRFFHFACAAKPRPNRLPDQRISADARVH